MISCKLIHVCMNSQEAAGSGGLLILVLVFGWLILTIPVLASRHLISGASGGQRASSWNPAFSLHASNNDAGRVDSLLDGVDPGNATPIACVVLTAAVAS